MSDTIIVHFGPTLLIIAFVVLIAREERKKLRTEKQKYDKERKKDEKFREEINCR